MGAIAANKNKDRILAELKRKGKKPSMKECEALGKRYGAHPTTVFKWAQKMYPAGPAAARKTPAAAPQADEAPAADPEPAAPQAAAPAPSGVPAAIRIDATPLPEQQLPTFGAEMGQQHAQAAQVKQPQASAPQAAAPSASVSQPPAITIDMQQAALPFIDLCTSLFEKGVQDIINSDPSAPPETKVPRPPEPVTQAEKEAAAAALGNLFAKYAPLYATYAVEINAAMVLGGIFIPRVLASRAYAQHVHAMKAAEREQRSAAEEERDEPKPKRVLGLELGGDVGDDGPTDPELGAKLARKLGGLSA